MNFHFFCNCQEKLLVETEEFPIEISCSNCGQKYRLSTKHVDGMPTWNSFDIQPVASEPPDA